MGDYPQRYPVHTPDDHVFVQFATRAERKWPGPEVLEMLRTKARAVLGFWATVAPLKYATPSSFTTSNSAFFLACVAGQSPAP
jgi:hypothetical protein